MHKEPLTFVIVYRRCHYKTVYIWSVMHDHDMQFGFQRSLIKDVRLIA